jgi:Icc-related predicted phosphoesterase
MFLRKKQGLKLFYASDVHGSERCYLKFLNAAKFYGAQVLILGGDLTGKAVVPIVQQSGHWKATFLGQPFDLTTETEVADLEKKVRFNGFYPYRTTPDEVVQMDQNAEYMKTIFDRLMKEAVERWIGLAHERLHAIGASLYVIAGNDDEHYIDEVLQASDFVHFNDGTVSDVGTYQMIGFSYANPTPWDSPRELPEDQLYERLAELANKLDPQRPAIFNLHVPPYNSKLDEAPELKEDLSYVLIGGQPHFIPVGSKAIRRIIEERQPVLGLHGHIHESRAVSKVGRTLVINPGSRYGEGILDGALVTLGEKGVEAYQLVAG